MLSDGILKHFFVQPYHPASPLPFGPLPCGPLSSAVQQGGRPAQPVSFWHGAFPSPPALPGALLSLRISARRLTAGYLPGPACGCPAGWKYRRIYVPEPLAPVSFFRLRFFPEGVEEGEPGQILLGRLFRGRCIILLAGPRKRGRIFRRTLVRLFFRRSRLAGFLASFVPGCFCRFFFGSGIVSER